MRQSAAFLIAFVSVACGARTALPGSDEAVSSGGGGSDEGGAGGEGGQGGGVGGVEQLGLGAQHSCVRTFDGSVYCWGHNARGQLGVGGVDDSLKPVRVKLPTAAVYLATGTYHSCVIDVAGDMWCWGGNDSGQLGDGTTNDHAKPVRVKLPRGALPEQMTLGEKHSCAILREAETSAGELWCWGSNEAGQLGLGEHSAEPVPIALGVREVAAGQFHTCWIEDDGDPLCVGDNSSMQCGVEEPQTVSVPVVPEGLAKGIENIRSAGRHNCSFTAESVHCWGDNGSGQLGERGPWPSLPQWSPILELPGVADVRPGLLHTCALASGQVQCWGDNGSGQLGTAGPSHPDPAPVPGLTGILAIGSGTLHTCAYRSSTEVYCWGGNDFGQLGDGTTNSSNVPVLIELP